MERDLSDRGHSTSTTANGSARIVMSDERDSVPPTPGRPWWAVDVRWLIEKVGVPSVILGAVLWGVWKIQAEEHAEAARTHRELAGEMSKASDGLQAAARVNEKNGERLERIERAIEKLIDTIPRRR